MISKLSPQKIFQKTSRFWRPENQLKTWNSDLISKTWKSKTWKSENMGFQGITSAWKWFQNLLQIKFQKMAEKGKFMVFRALFSLKVHIQQRWYLTGRNSFWSIIRRKKTYHFKIIKKSIMAVQKCKNILLQAALKIIC